MTDEKRPDDKPAEKTDAEVKAAAAQSIGAALDEVTGVEDVSDGQLVTTRDTATYHVDGETGAVTYFDGPHKAPENLPIDVYAGEAVRGDKKPAKPATPPPAPRR